MADKKRELFDGFQRAISYLRISITDQCNFRCSYCVGETNFPKLSTTELLSYEELYRIVAIAVQMGIRKVRLTGGEPLLRKGVIEFIRKINAIPGLEDIRLTTNGLLLEEYAGQLVESGVRTFNISLDTLKKKRFKEITGFDGFDKVWAGIKKASVLSPTPVKLNMVVLNGINDDELLDFAGLSLAHPFQVRFIEYMPIGRGSDEPYSKISNAEIMSRLEILGTLTPVARGPVQGPARVYRYENAPGTIGFISPISHKFCSSCNRLRLTATGGLRSCLLVDVELNLKGIIRSGGSDEAIREVFLQAIRNKPREHSLLDKGAGSCHGRMSRIGG
ncbi:MAG: GTP 3',8-cyclase MoaA [Proteobacteria bacterium]|nr:GTP 3',8-cyclase MoaA [Pseudomonadota bacterium]MBU1709333.1 GTP 3',8-cyclase MoaA [Pseudomonadota bacterium]